MKRTFFVCVAAAALLCGCVGNVHPAPDIHDEDDLGGLTVTTVAGTFYDISLSMRPDIDRKFFKNTTDCLEALQKGMVDVMVEDEDVLTDEDMKRMGLKVAFKGKMDLPTAFGFKKGNTELISLFNEFLSQIRSDGTLDSIISFWSSKHVVQWEDIPKIPEVSEGMPLKVGTCAMNAPVSYVLNGTWVGMEVELVRRFAAWIGCPVEVSYFDIPSLIFGLQSGTLDMMMGSITITEERQESIDFGDVFMVKHPAYFVRDNQNAEGQGTVVNRMKGRLYQNIIHDNRWHYISDGLLETLKISFFSVILGSLLGILLCAMAGSRNKFFNGFVSLYVLLMRGIPMLVLLLFMFYVVFSGSGGKPTLVAIIAFALNFASGASGVFRSSLDSVPRGQTEAGLALGFSRLAAFFRIVLPQAVRKGLASFKGNCVTLVKNTSVVGYIAIVDLTRASDIIRSRTFDAFLPLVIISIIYLILAWAIGKILDITLKQRKAYVLRQPS
ncbi:MAG: ABC transporter permease subunit [Bacteroidales bacterium]|nr:ABC transporter permease subunit [Bacteroidales bacterium]